MTAPNEPNHNLTPSLSPRSNGNHHQDSEALAVKHSGRGKKGGGSTEPGRQAHLSAETLTSPCPHQLCSQEGDIREEGPTGYFWGNGGGGLSP